MRIISVKDSRTRSAEGSALYSLSCFFLKFPGTYILQMRWMLIRIPRSRAVEMDGIRQTINMVAY